MYNEYGNGSGMAALGSLLLDPSCDTPSSPPPVHNPTPTPSPTPTDTHSSQAQDQDQAQAQDQGQTQAQSAYNESDNSNHNADCNSNDNGNGNLNLNGNGNLNLNGNENANYNLNSTETAVTTAVNVGVNVEGSFGPPNESHVMHMDNLDVDNTDGSFLVMPDFSTQTLNGNGNIFDLHEVNSLVSNGTVSDPSVGLWVGGGGEGGCIDGCLSAGDMAHGGATNFSFGQTGTEAGNYASSSAYNAEAASGAATASVAGLNQEAFTQHISLGANIQYNSMPISVVGGDSLSDVHDSLSHSYHS